MDPSARAAFYSRIHAAGRQRENERPEEDGEDSNNTDVQDKLKQQAEDQEDVLIRKGIVTTTDHPEGEVNLKSNTSMLDHEDLLIRKGIVTTNNHTDKQQQQKQQEKQLSSLDNKDTTKSKSQPTSDNDKKALIPAGAVAVGVPAAPQDDNDDPFLKKETPKDAVAVGVPTAAGPSKAGPIPAGAVAVGVPTGGSTSKDPFLKKENSTKKTGDKENNDNGEEGGSNFFGNVFNGIERMPFSSSTNSQAAAAAAYHHRQAAASAAANYPGAYRHGGGHGNGSAHLLNSFHNSTNAEAPQLFEGLRNSQLAVANLVEPGIPRESLPQAEQMMDGSNNSEKFAAAAAAKRKSTIENNQRRTILLMVIMFVSVIVVVIATLASTSSSSSSSNQQDNNDGGSGSFRGTLAPNTTMTTLDPKEEYILSLLPQSTVETIQSSKPMANVTTTPQGLAYQWLLQDPNLLSYPSWRVVQRFALVTFFEATGGKTWFNNTHWLSYDHHECEWFSSTNGAQVIEAVESWFIVKSEAVSPLVKEYLLNGTACSEGWEEEGDDEDSQQIMSGAIQSLKMLDNNLTGSLPDELYLITSLESIFFFDNPSIMGDLSSSRIGNLKDLEIIYISGTKLSGSVPTEMGLLSNLHTVELFSNSLTGPIPSQLGLLSNLDRLQLDSNQLTGMIPTELAQLQLLHTLYLHTNDLTGTLPTELGLLYSIYDLQIHTTLIHGTVPTELFQLPEMGKLLIRRQLLTGTIPTEVALLPSAWWVDFWANSMEGTIPSQVGLMKTLQFWFSNENQMSGTLPTEFGGLEHNLTRLYLNRGGFDGPIPSELGLCTKMEMLWLNHNDFEGDVSQSIFQPMTALSYLQLKNNSFTGQIPSDAGTFTDLRWLEAGQNSFSGTVPSELGNLVGMSRLDLQDNNFQGTVPFEVTNLTQGSLRQLYLAGNPLLSGTMPSFLCESFDRVFDCTELLCGCDCSCLSMNISSSTSNETL